MRRGDWWRIGRCTTAHRPHRPGGVGEGLATEQADDGWILSIHETMADAAVSEAKWQNQYGIPGTTFQAARTLSDRTLSDRTPSDRQLAEIHEADKKAVGRRVEQLFGETGLQKEQPLYTNAPMDSETVRTKKDGHIFTTAAGNLAPMSGYIRAMIPHPKFLEGRDEAEHAEPILMTATVSQEPFEGTVYGLDVPPSQHYVSGGAVVHNSVKGAESDVVYLFPDISRAGMTEWRGNDAQKASVYRLFYVGMTRARESLVLCQAADDRCVDFTMRSPK